MGRCKSLCQIQTGAKKPEVMRLDRRTALYNYAQKKGIEVDWFPMQTAAAFSLPLDGACAIAIDPQKISSAADESVKLAHELGHCVYGGFYNRASPLDVKEQHEYKANVWAVQRMIPWSRLRAAVRSGTTEVWELAELFGVTESFMHWAIDYYVQTKGKAFD